jgi:hypothetical protein
VAKSRRKRQQRRQRSGGHPARRTSAPSRSPAELELELELERMAELAFAEARRRSEEALSPDTPPERVAALVVEEFEDLPSPPGLAIRLRHDGSEQRARAVAAEVARLAPGSRWRIDAIRRAAVAEARLLRADAVRPSDPREGSLSTGHPRGARHTESGFGRWRSLRAR